MSTEEEVFVPKHFVLPQLQINPNGWGPSTEPKLFNGMPYQTFNKNDRLGMVRICSLFLVPKSKIVLLRLPIGLAILTLISDN